MPLGSADQQYDESWFEQDKVRRRLELKKRLKFENVMLRYNPFRHMKREYMTDPAVERYMDLRKRGRQPNTPLNPKIFFTYFFVIFVPIGGLTWLINWERKSYLDAVASGEITYRQIRWNKCHK